MWVHKEQGFLRQRSWDLLRALCWWISSSRLWDWAWQLAQWRWFMTGQESQRWMRRNNFDQSFPLTTEESSLLVPVDIWQRPDVVFQREAAESVCLFYICTVVRYTVCTEFCTGEKEHAITSYYTWGSAQNVVDILPHNCQHSHQIIKNPTEDCIIPRKHCST